MYRGVGFLGVIFNSEGSVTSSGGLRSEHGGKLGTGADRRTKNLILRPCVDAGHTPSAVTLATHQLSFFLPTTCVIIIIISLQYSWSTICSSRAYLCLRGFIISSCEDGGPGLPASDSSGCAAKVRPRQRRTQLEPSTSGGSRPCACSVFSAAAIMMMKVALGMH